MQLIKASTKASTKKQGDLDNHSSDVVFALVTHFSPSQNPTLSVYKIKPLTESGYHIFYL